MTTPSVSQPQSSTGGVYRIRVGQRLDTQYADWLGGLVITNLDNGEAILTGVLVDQSALYGVLQCLCNLNVPLLDLTRVNGALQNSQRNDYDK